MTAIAVSTAPDAVSGDELSKSRVPGNNRGIWVGITAIHQVCRAVIVCFVARAHFPDAFETRQGAERLSRLSGRLLPC